MQETQSQHIFGFKTQRQTERASSDIKFLKIFIKEGKRQAASVNEEIFIYVME